MQHVWGPEEVYTWLWWGDPMERDHLEDLDVDGTVILKRIFKKWDGKARIGLNWLRRAIGGGRL
jgi:hypothetical protein